MPLRTEADAKTTICARSAGTSVTTRCQGNDCMAWRFVGWRKADGTIDASPKKNRGDDAARLGFCGMAGRPGDEA